MILGDRSFYGPLTNFPEQGEIGPARKSKTLNRRQQRKRRESRLTLCFLCRLLLAEPTEHGMPSLGEQKSSADTGKFRNPSQEAASPHHIGQFRGNGPATTMLAVRQVPTNALAQCCIRRHFVLRMPGFVECARFHFHWNREPWIPRNTYFALPPTSSLTSQMRTVPSSLPDASSVPSRERARVWICPSWAL